MKVAFARIAQESNSLSPVDTTLHDFESGHYLSGAALRSAVTDGPEVKGFFKRAELAGFYARQDKAVEAVNAAEDALKYDPNNREANRILGTIYSVLADQKRPLRPGDDPSQYLSQAIAALEKARGDGADLNLLLTLGKLQLRAGQYEKAIVSLRRIVEGGAEFGVERVGAPQLFSPAHGG